MSAARWAGGAAVVTAVCLATVGCSRPTPPGGPSADAPVQGAAAASSPSIVAVSPVVADIVANLAPGASIETLAPLGDPASFEPSEDDKALAADADLVIGTAQELQNLGLPGAQVAGAEPGPINFFIGAGSESAYPWLDPRTAAIWVMSLAESLAALDPAGATGYRDSAERYARELAVASGMLLETARAIPPERRTFLTDAPEAAAALAGALDADFVPRPLVAGVTSVAAADAMSTDELAAAVREAGDSFVFLVAPGNQSRASDIADAAGRPLGLLFLVSLTGPDGPAPDYLSMMRFNAESLMEALGSQEPPTP